MNELEALSNYVAWNPRERTPALALADMFQEKQSLSRVAALRKAVDARRAIRRGHAVAVACRMLHQASRAAAHRFLWIQLAAGMRVDVGRTVHVYPGRTPPKAVRYVPCPGGSNDPLWKIHVGAEWLIRVEKTRKKYQRRGYDPTPEFIRSL